MSDGTPSFNQQTAIRMKVYPVYLNRLDEKKTVLVGGDHEAERKAGELLECDALLTVISPVLTEKLQWWADQGRFEWIPRMYRKGDLKGAFMAIVADYEGNTNEQVFREAEEEGILVNVMDDIPHCNFTFGSIVKRGPLTISVSTSGAAPVLSVRLRQQFEKEFGDEYRLFLEFMKRLRRPMAEMYPDFETRRKLWYKLADSDLLDMFRDENPDRIYKYAAEIVGEETVNRALEIGAGQAQSG